MKNKRSFTTIFILLLLLSVVFALAAVTVRGGCFLDVSSLFRRIFAALSALCALLAGWVFIAKRRK